MKRMIRSEQFALLLLHSDEYTVCGMGILKWFTLRLQRKQFFQICSVLNGF